MCGIVGYVGRRDACPILIKGLHRLEYRGYDSAGVALVNPDGRLNVFKCKGKGSDLEHFLDGKDLGGNIGIAHTRWSTHGVPSDANAHPHYSESENIALIHNGIIENYRVLKDALEQNGYTFRSSTDSEVLVNLIEYVRATSGCSLPEAVRQALRQVIGAYAIAVVEKGNHDRIVAARQSSPMVVGVGDGEFFLSSDAASIIEYTEDFVYVGDGEIAVIDRNAPLKIVTLDNHDAKIDIKKLQLSISQLEKGGYPHFMLKEIYEQPRTIVDCIRGRINPDTCEVKLSGVSDHRDRFVNARRIIFVACGTSWHASLIGEHLVESICRIPVEVEYASEFRYRNPIIREDDIVVAVSQSGETADTLAAVELARKAGAFVFGICNVVGSSIARATDSGAYIHVGPEIGVASTKAFTGQVTVMAMLALAVGRERGTVTEAYYNEVSAALLHLPETMEEVLKVAPQVADLEKIFTYAHNFIYLGRGYNYPTALEGALNAGVTPVEVKETLYQAVPYVGMAKVADFVGITNEVLEARGVTLPLAGQSTTSSADRFEKGLAVQRSIFGAERIDGMREAAPANQKHIQRYLSDNCFGDFLTRGGLDVKLRELLTFSMLVSLGGCESQVKGHIAGNANIGNDKATLLAVVTQLLPYIGYPRSLNVMNIIDEVAGKLAKQ